MKELEKFTIELGIILRLRRNTDGDANLKEITLL
jgi:hypothetical protein